MRDIWTEGSSARKYDEWYRNKPNSGRQNHSCVYQHSAGTERRNAQAIAIEYIEPPERYSVKHPVKTAINKGAYAATDAVVRTCHAIPTRVISDINQGLILTTDWINTAIGAITVLLACVGWGYVLFSPMDIMVRAELLWMCGYGTAAVCTILILLYRYHQILRHRFDKAGGLRKRAKVVVSTKKTAFMLGRTLLFLYGVLIPGVAKICIAIFL